MCGDVCLNILSKWMAMKSKGCDNRMLDFKETHMLGTTRIQMDSGINTSAKHTTEHPKLKWNVRKVWISHVAATVQTSTTGYCLCEE
jgi:hypothetical protein